MPEKHGISPKSTTYIDINLEALRDDLSIVLKDIKGLSLGEEKPAVSPTAHGTRGLDPTFLCTKSLRTLTL